MPITDSELTVSLDGTKPGKEDPHYVGKAEGLGDSLPSPQSCMPHHIDGMAGEEQTEQHKAPPTQCSGESSHSVHTWCGPMAITRLYIYLPWVNSKGLQWCKPQQSSPKGWIWHLAWQSRYQTYNIQNGGRLNSEKETYLWRAHGIIGTGLKRHQRWRLLLWHRGMAKNTSRASWCQGWQQNYIMLTQDCRKPLQRGSHGHQ